MDRRWYPRHKTAAQVCVSYILPPNGQVQVPYWQQSQRPSSVFLGTERRERFYTHGESPLELLLGTSCQTEASDIDMPECSEHEIQVKYNSCGKHTSPENRRDSPLHYDLATSFFPKEVHIKATMNTDIHERHSIVSSTSDLPRFKGLLLVICISQRATGSFKQQMNTARGNDFKFYDLKLWIS